MRHPSRAIWALFLVAAGCPVPEPSGQCRPDDVVSGSDVAGAEVTVQVGQGTRGDFAPYTDGQQVSLVRGSQGGLMVTPTVRLTGLTAAPSDDCISVAIDNHVVGTGAPDDVLDYESGMRFEQAGADWVSLPIYDMLGYGTDGLVGNHLTLEVTVEAPGFKGEATASVVLGPP